MPREKPSKQHTIGILGAGGWGTAIAKVLTEAGHRVDVWSFEPDVAQEINTKRTNSKYLVGVSLPHGMTAHTDFQPVLEGKDFVLLAIPSLYLMSTVDRLVDTGLLDACHSLVGVLTKGFVEIGNDVRLVTDVLEERLSETPTGNLVYISGPSHAEEVARGKITGLISASTNGINAIRFRELLSSGRLIVFSSLDVIGVQVSAAAKNVIAVAFGMLAALQEFSTSFGENTESLLLAAGLNEIQRLGIAMGSNHPETFTSIAGVGDLDVTCRSKYGRNRRFGQEVITDHALSRYRNLDELVQDFPQIGYVPEGVIAARCVSKLAQKYGLELPISLGVYRILNRETEPIEELENILRRITKEESLTYLLP